MRHAHLFVKHPVLPSSLNFAWVCLFLRVPFLGLGAKENHHFGEGVPKKIPTCRNSMLLTAARIRPAFCATFPRQCGSPDMLVVVRVLHDCDTSLRGGVVFEGTPPKNNGGFPLVGLQTNRTRGTINKRTYPYRTAHTHTRAPDDTDGEWAVLTTIACLRLAYCCSLIALLLPCK